MSKFNSVLIKIIEWLLALLLGVAVLFIISQVFFRYGLHSPLSWTEQTSRYLFVWMMMLGTAVMFYRNSAMAFDLLLHNMPKKLRFWIEALIIMIIIAFAAYYSYQALILTIKVAGRFTSGVRVPLNFMYSSMFVSNLFVVLVMVEKFIDHLRGKTVLPEKEG